MRKIPIFSELNHNDLLTVFEHLKTTVIPPGFTIVQQGTPCTAVFFVEEGVCLMIKGSSNFVGFIKLRKLLLRGCAFVPPGKNHPQRCAPRDLHCRRSHGGTVALPGDVLHNRLPKPAA